MPAIEIYNIIGASLRLPKEDKDPFAYLGLVSDFNGIDVTQTRKFIKLSCGNYIDRIMTSHGWETSSPSDNPHTATPLRMDVLNQLANHTDGPKEGTREHELLQQKQKFSYRTLLGEMMFACEDLVIFTMLSLTSSSLRGGRSPTRQSIPLRCSQ